MGSISIRVYIRWLPASPSEPTSTLVLTTQARYFVDVRILHHPPDGSPPPRKDDTLPLDRLDWAFAGMSTSSPAKSPDGTEFQHCTWHHWVDSRAPVPEEPSDSGDNYAQDDGTTLEKGRMVNPATGQETDYEELWRDLEPTATTGLERAAGDRRHFALVLRLQEDEHARRGMAIRLGQFCQAVLRDGDSITAEKWAWTEAGGWKRVTKIGSGTLPCDIMVDQTKVASLMIGSHVLDDKGRSWTALEVSND